MYGTRDMTSFITWTVYWKRLIKRSGLSICVPYHLNDSRNPCGAHKDRHEKIGQGYIGFDALVSVTRHKALCHLPFFLETPQSDNDGYAREIAMLRDAP